MTGKLAFTPKHTDGLKFVVPLHEHNPNRKFNQYILDHFFVSKV